MIGDGGTDDDGCFDQGERSFPISPAPTRARTLIFLELHSEKSSRMLRWETYVQTSCATWLELTRGGSKCFLK